MGRITFVLGGARSGKSSFAERLARDIEAGGGRIVYLATCGVVAGDTEMSERISRHRARRPASWTTVEEPMDLTPRAFALARGETLLVDCLSLWVSNMLCGADESVDSGDGILARVRTFLSAAAASAGDVILVSNETGCGVVPVSGLGRRYRDILGWANQAAADAADEVWFLVAGLPQRLNGSSHKIPDPSHAVGTEPEASMDTLRDTIAKIRPLCGASMEAARRRQDILTKPRGSLGRLEELSVRLAGIRRTSSPCVREKVILTMAGDHGVVAEGVTLYPSEVTVQQIRNFLRGGGGVNVLARHVGARVVLVDMGVNHDFAPDEGIGIRKVAKGTANILHGPAMTPEEALRAVEEGIAAAGEEAARGMDILGTGEMGIGNSTPSAAIVCAVTGESVEAVTGRGAGLSDDGLRRKIAVIGEALRLNRPDPTDGLDVLAKVGGFEIGGIAGAILGAAALGIPVVVDGFISTAGAMIAALLCPLSKDYMFFSHRSEEVGHEYMLRFFGARPLLDLGLRLGEGTGAALAISLVEASARILSEMSTFESAGVSGPLETGGGV